MAHLPWAKLFDTNHYSYFHVTIGPFHCAKFKTDSYSGSRVMRMCHFWSQNVPFAQMKFFSDNPLIRLVPFIHAYLHAKNQSQILYSSIIEILTIKEYWNFIGWELFLAIAWESDHSQACSFCRMLMKHNNFYNSSRQN